MLLINQNKWMKLSVSWSTTRIYWLIPENLGFPNVIGKVPHWNSLVVFLAGIKTWLTSASTVDIKPVEITAKMKTIFIISIFLAAFVSDIECGPTRRKERRKRSVFDIIPFARNIPTRNTTIEDLPKNTAGLLCHCKNRGNICVLDVKLRCRRVIDKGWGRRKRGGTRHRRRKHMKTIRRKFKKWLKEN